MSAQPWRLEPSQPTCLPSLMEELVEEILLRLPPREPTSLVRAALVCKLWRRLVSNPRFRHRFLEFHRTPPILGFICNYWRDRSSFVRTTVSSPLHSLDDSNTSRWWCDTLDSRHGRVLLREKLMATVRMLLVWEPITDQLRELPDLPRPTVCCTAAILCATTTGACDHHGCHCGPFKVVFVGTEPENKFVCTYSSDVDAWSKPISIQHIESCFLTFGGYSPSVLLGNELYFGIPMTNAVLRYDLELHQQSWIQLPTRKCGFYSSVLTTMDDDGLRLVTLTEGKLRLWLRMDTPKADAGWTQFKVIDLWTQQLDDVHPDYTPHAFVVGSADGLGIVFVTVNDALYTVDLETNMVKKQVYNGRQIEAIFPYMRFYSPALEAASFGVEEEPSADGSSA